MKPVKAGEKQVRASELPKNWQFVAIVEPIADSKLLPGGGGPSDGLSGRCA